MGRETYMYSEAEYQQLQTELNRQKRFYQESQDALHASNLENVRLKTEILHLKRKLAKIEQNSYSFRAVKRRLHPSPFLVRPIRR